MPEAHQWEVIPTHGGPIDHRCVRCGQIWFEGDPVPSTYCQPAPAPPPVPPKMTLSQIQASAQRTADTATGTSDEVRHLAYLVAQLAQKSSTIL